MGEQNGFVKRHPATGHARVQRHTGQRFEHVTKRQRHKGRAGLCNRQAELAGDLIAQPARPHLGDRFAATGDDEIPAAQNLAGVQCHRKPVAGALNRRNAGPQPHLGRAHLGNQHVDDLFGGFIAKQLPQRFFVISDAMS